ncbi:MAG: hypothetical protein GY755_09325 [Chloroflexi bacterium]|nr:hypothetical protein [Chloroflexota bacterium]
MKTLRIFYHLARADLYERVRRYSFLIMLGLSAFLGYQTAIGNLTIRLDTYRGEFNSAWVGSMVALIASFFFGWFGFYLVKGSVMHDRKSGVGQIMATTPITRPLYTFGKWASNMAVFMAMLLILAIASIGIQLLAGENTNIDLIALFAPFLFVTIPLLAFVSAIAVLFETIGFLQGGLGNIIYFFLFIFIIPLGMSLEDPALEPLGFSLLENSMAKVVTAQFPSYQGGFVLGAAPGVITDTFVWSGIDWTPSIIAARFSFFGIGAIIALLAALFFDRFDPSRRKIKIAKKRKKDDIHQSPSEEIKLSEPVRAVRLLPLNTDVRHPSFFPVFRAEIKLLLKGQRWLWCAIAIGLIIASLLSPSDITRSIILPMAWIWPILLWSSLGNREIRHNVSQMVFSSPSPVWRHILAQWSAGFMLAIMVASGTILRLGLDGDLSGLLMLLSGAIFIPSLAIVSGVWSNGSKLFEILYVLIWYLGPMNRIPALDFIGSTPESQPEVFMLASVLLLALAIAGRARQVKNG